jgi:two-component system, response regulator PdtaR
MTGKENRMGQTNTRKTALVVEDDVGLRCLASSLLEETDLDVVEADTGDRALAYLTGHADRVALVFTDVAMPGKVDGVDLARRIAQQWPWIRVVVTSGYIRWPHSDLPATVAFMPKPWRALDILVHAEQAVRAA